MKQSNPIVVKLLLSLSLVVLAAFITLLLSAFILPNPQEAVSKAIQAGANITPDIQSILLKMKLSQGIQTVGFFLLPALIILFVFYKKKGVTLPLTTHVSGRDIFDVIFLIVFTNTIMYVVAQYSQMLPWPEFLLKDNEQSQTLTNMLLSGASYGDLAINLTIVCLLPAVCEEFLFRGFLQRMLMKWFSDPHISIFIAAVVFSAFHFDAVMFIPRFLLGAILGYLFYWTGSLIIPMLAHFINNAQVVVGAFIIEKMQNKPLAQVSSGDVTVDNFNLILSVLLMAFLLYSIYNRHMSTKEFIRIGI